MNSNNNNDEKLKLNNKNVEIDKPLKQLLMMSSPSTSRVTLISQQLEDTYYSGNTKLVNTVLRLNIEIIFLG